MSYKDYNRQNSLLTFYLPRVADFIMRPASIMVSDTLAHNDNRISRNILNYNRIVLNSDLGWRHRACMVYLSLFIHYARIIALLNGT